MKSSVVPRVLHVVESLNRNAIENWLARMLGHARSRSVPVDWTFYCTIDQRGMLEDVVRERGARIVVSPVPIGRKMAFVRALRRELRRGQYDVLHAHHDLVSAVYLLAAVGLPLAKRVVHVHNADEEVLTPSKLKQRLIREPMRRVCLVGADRIVGISQHTLDVFLGGRPRLADRDRVLYYGVDSAPFAGPTPDANEFRRSLSLPDDARILLFAGRMVPEKNPLFAVEVLAEMHRQDSRVAGVFVGTGALESAATAQADSLGVAHAYRALGWRDDLPNIMRCCDWFILPHLEDHKEGLGLAVVEAQLGGLRLLLSRGILPDALLPTARARQLGLAAGPTKWASAALGMLHDSPPSADDARVALAQSKFDLDRALDGLLALHQ